MKVKQLAILLAVLLLGAMLAMPVSAVPEDEVVTFAEPGTQDIAITTAPDISGESAIAPEDQTAPQQTQPQTYAAIMPYQAQEQTSAPFTPIRDDMLRTGQQDSGLLSQRNMTLAALCLSAAAVLLSIIALLRTRKKIAPNATGNYQKYF